MDCDCSVKLQVPSITLVPIGMSSSTVTVKVDLLNKGVNSFLSRR